MVGLQFFLNKNYDITLMIGAKSNLKTPFYRLNYDEWNATNTISLLPILTE
jgi:hypothetical protein